MRHGEGGPSAALARSEQVLRWLALVSLVLAVSLVPFFAAGETVERWTVGLANTLADRANFLGLLLGLLLAADIVLPVPSSLVSTALGGVLGWAGGFLVSTFGMTAACWIGYQLGAGAGRGAAHLLIRERDLAWLEAASERWGSGVIVMFRAVPVLAEASAIFAGMSRMRRGRYMALATLSNAGISAVYAAVGAYSASVNSFLLAFIAAMLLPGLALLAIRWARRQQRPLLPSGPVGGERPL